MKMRDKLIIEEVLKNYNITSEIGLTTSVKETAGEINLSVDEIVKVLASNKDEVLSLINFDKKINAIRDSEIEKFENDKGDSPLFDIFNFPTFGDNDDPYANIAIYKLGQEAINLASEENGHSKLIAKTLVDDPKKLEYLEDLPFYPSIEYIVYCASTSERLKTNEIAEYISTNKLLDQIYSCDTVNDGDGMNAFFGTEVFIHDYPREQNYQNYDRDLENKLIVSLTINNYEADEDNEIKELLELSDSVSSTLKEYSTIKADNRAELRMEIANDAQKQKAKRNLKI